MFTLIGAVIDIVVILLVVLTLVAVVLSAPVYLVWLLIQFAEIKRVTKKSKKDFENEIRRITQEVAKEGGDKIK